MIVKSRKSHEKKENSNNPKVCFSNFIFHDKGKNLSDLSFDDEEMGLLNHGLKFSIADIYK